MKTFPLGLTYEIFRVGTTIIVGDNFVRFFPPQRLIHAGIVSDAIVFPARVKAFVEKISYYVQDSGRTRLVL